MPSSQEPPNGSGIRTGDWLVLGTVLALAGGQFKNRFFSKQPNPLPQTRTQAVAQDSFQAGHSPASIGSAATPTPQSPVDASAAPEAVLNEDSALVAELRKQGLEPVLDANGKLVRDPSTKVPLVREAAKKPGRADSDPVAATTPTSTTGTGDSNLSDAEHRLMERLKASELTQKAERAEAAMAAANSGKTADSNTAADEAKKQANSPPASDAPRSMGESGWDNFGGINSRSVPTANKDKIQRKDVKVNGETVPIYTCSPEVTPDECAVILAQRSAEDKAATQPAWAPSSSGFQIAKTLPSLPSSSKRETSISPSPSRPEISAPTPTSSPRQVRKELHSERRVASNVAPIPQPSPAPRPLSHMTATNCATLGGGACQGLKSDLKVSKASAHMSNIAAMPNIQMGAGGNISSIDFSGSTSTFKTSTFFDPKRTDDCHGKNNSPNAISQAQDPKKFPPSVQALYQQLAVKDKKRAQDLLLNNQKAACEMGVNPSTGDAASCYDDPPGAACNCQSAFDQHYSIGAVGSAGQSYAKMWKDLRSPSTQRNHEVMAKAFEKDPVRKELLLSYLETICTGDNCPSGGAGIFNAVERATGDRPDLSALRNFEGNRMLSTSLALHGSANVLEGYPPVCAAVNPIGTANLMNHEGLTGFEDACHQLSSTDPERLGELDHFEILATMSFATELGAEVDTKLRNTIPNPSFIDETHALVDTIEMQKGFSYRDYQPQSSTKFPTASKLTGIYRNLLQCNTPGQLGWAFRRAEEDMRKLAVDQCSSKEAQGFQDAFGTNQQRQSFIEPFRHLGGIANADPLKGQAPGVDFTQVGNPPIGFVKAVRFSNCNEFSIRGRLAAPSPPIDSPVPPLHSGMTDCPGDSNRRDRADSYINATNRSTPEAQQGYTDFIQQMEAYYANRVFAEITKQIPPSYAPSAAAGPIDGIGLLKGAKFHDCTELLNAHRVMMYLIMDRNSFAASRTSPEQSQSQTPGAKFQDTRSVRQH